MQSIELFIQIYYNYNTRSEPGTKEGDILSQDRYF